MTIKIAEQQPREQLTFRMPYGALAYKEISEMCRIVRPELSLEDIMFHVTGWPSSTHHYAFDHTSVHIRILKRVGRQHEVVDGPAGQWFCLRKTALFHQDAQWVPWRLTASSGQSVPPVCNASAHGVVHVTSAAQLFLLPAWPTTRGRLGRRAIPCHVGRAGTSVDPAAFSRGPSLAHVHTIDAFLNLPDVGW
ncbi:hypothetical protein T05_1287 [Trichinella murrelli]|uniref:Uncharacterized protein n=1 Tax=Trichinella murrelli TaxID=144512 RepID=A0A0V0TM71_9BILA|nr:hypothetical protein T05_1287 [Trichinella murrelli]